MTRLSLPYQGFLVNVFSVTLYNLVAMLILKAESLTTIISFRDKELEVCMLTCGPVKKIILPQRKMTWSTRHVNLGKIIMEWNETEWRNFVSDLVNVPLNRWLYDLLFALMNKSLKRKLLYCIQGVHDGLKKANVQNTPQMYQCVEQLRNSYKFLVLRPNWGNCVKQTVRFALNAQRNRNSQRRPWHSTAV